MYPYMFFLLLLIYQTLTANESIKVTVKTKQVQDELQVKVLMQADIVSPELAQRENIPIYYISSLVVKTDDETLVSAYLSSYFISVVKFKFATNITNDSIDLFVADNNTQTVKKSAKIKNYFAAAISSNPYKASKKFKAPSSDVIKAVNSDDAINALYGSSKTVEGNFTIEFKGDSVITLEDGMCSSSGRLNMSIESNKKLDTLAIFQDANKYSTIAVFHDHSSFMHYYGVNFKIKKTSVIKVVGRGTDGLLYESQFKMYVIPSSHSDCYGNLSGPYMVY